MDWSINCRITIKNKLTTTLTQFTKENFYTEQINELTLAEAFKIHYEINPQFTPWYNCKSEILQKMMRSHNISHIIYGCNTSLLGEMQVQFWNQFGSFVPKTWADIKKAFADKETRQIITPTGLIPFFLTHISEIFRVKKQTKLMTKKWVFFDEEKYMNIIVGEIRSEYNIKILNPESNPELSIATK